MTPGPQKTPRRIPLLRDLQEPRTTSAMLRDMDRRLAALEHSAAGYVRPEEEKEYTAGSVGIPFLVIDPESGAVVGEGTGGLEFAFANQIVISDGAGTTTFVTIPLQSLVGRKGSIIGPIQISSNEFVARAGGDLGGIAVAVSRILGRTAAGNLDALTPNDAADTIDAFERQRSTFGTVVLLTGASPSDTLDQDTDCVVTVQAWTGTATVNLPTGAGVRVGKAFLLCDTKRAASVGTPISIAPGTGNFIDAGGAGVALVLNGGTAYTAGGWIVCVAKSGSVLTWAFMGQP
jgi:hypothetical protein